MSGKATELKNYHPKEAKSKRRERGTFTHRLVRGRDKYLYLV